MNHIWSNEASSLLLSGEKVTQKHFQTAAPCGAGSMKVFCAFPRGERDQLLLCYNWPLSNKAKCSSYGTMPVTVLDTTPPAISPVASTSISFFDYYLGKVNSKHWKPSILYIWGLTQNRTCALATIEYLAKHPPTLYSLFLKDTSNICIKIRILYNKFICFQDVCTVYSLLKHCFLFKRLSIFSDRSWEISAINGIKNTMPITPNNFPPINTANKVQNGESPTLLPTTCGYMNWFSTNCETW